MYHGIHLRAELDELHDLDAQAGDQIAGDDELAGEAHAQPAVLGLDD